MTQIPGLWRHTALLLVALGVVAALSPEPWYLTDREYYQELGRSVLSQDCSSLHCSRALLAAVIEHLPGPSIPKWKAFAVLGNTWAAAAVALLAVQVGVSVRAAHIAFWLSGLGFGALFTLFDPYSSDPLMFALGPMLTLWLVRGRLRAAGIGAGAGVFAKEFAVAPLWIWALVSAIARRWFDAARTATVALTVTTVWLVFQLALVIGANYSYGGNPSANLFGGGYIVPWFNELGARVAIGALVTEYGPLYVLAPLGLLFASRQLQQLAIAMLPALAAFAYVQQPDRALWNFHFVVTPLAALVLERVSLGVVGALFAAVTFANLRLAAQLQFLPAARYAFAVSMLVAGAAAIMAWRGRTHPSPGRGPAGPSETRRFGLAYRTLLTVSATVAFVSLAFVADLAAHRAVERGKGLNRQGYRGDVMKAKADGEMRVAILGGATAFSPDETWEQSLAFVLNRFLHQGWRWQQMVPMTVADLSQPNDTAAELVGTLHRYEYLKPDIVCLLTGHNDLPGVVPTSGGRWQSAMFRAFGYLPALPAVVTGAPMAPAAPALPVDAEWIRARPGPVHASSTPDTCAGAFEAYCDAVGRAVDYSLSKGYRVLVVSEPFISSMHFAQQRALAAMLADRFGGDHRVRYLDLGRRVDLLDAALATGWRLTPRGIEEFTDDIFTGVFSMVTRS